MLDQKSSETRHLKTMKISNWSEPVQSHFQRFWEMLSRLNRQNYGDDVSRKWVQLLCRLIVRGKRSALNRRQVIALESAWGPRNLIRILIKTFLKENRGLRMRQTYQTLFKSLLHFLISHRITVHYIHERRWERDLYMCKQDYWFYNRIFGHTCHI